MPRGAPFGLETLAGLGVDRQSAARQARSGWLVRLGQGVYAFPNDPLGRAMTTVFLQTRLSGLHVACRTALDMHGYDTTLASTTRGGCGETDRPACRTGTSSDSRPATPAPGCSTETTNRCLR